MNNRPEARWGDRRSWGNGARDSELLVCVSEYGVSTELEWNAPCYQIRNYFVPMNHSLLAIFQEGNVSKIKIKVLRDCCIYMVFCLNCS